MYANNGDKARANRQSSLMPSPTRDMSFSINRIFASSGYPRPQRTARQIACARHVLPQALQYSASELTGVVKRIRPHIEHRFLKRRVGNIQLDRNRKVIEPASSWAISMNQHVHCNCPGPLLMLLPRCSPIRIYFACKKQSGLLGKNCRQ